MPYYIGTFLLHFQISLEDITHIDKSFHSLLNIEDDFSLGSDDSTLSDYSNKWSDSLEVCRVLSRS